MFFFLKILVAWMLFAIGAINIAREAYGYAVNPELQHHDWFGIIRTVWAALSLTGWWMLIH